MSKLQENYLYRVNLTSGMVHVLAAGCQWSTKLKAAHYDCSTLAEATYKADQAVKKHGKAHALCKHCDFDAATRKEHGED